MTQEIAIVLGIPQTGKLRSREVKGPAQGHPAREWTSWHSSLPAPHIWFSPPHSADTSGGGASWSVLAVLLAGSETGQANERPCAPVLSSITWGDGTVLFISAVEGTKLNYEM